MRLKRIKVSGFKSLRNTELTDVEQLNILIGRNSSGKSALLQAIALLPSDPLSTLPDVTLNASHGELQSDFRIELDVQLPQVAGQAEMGGHAGRPASNDGTSHPANGRTMHLVWTQSGLRSSMRVRVRNPRQLLAREQPLDVLTERNAIKGSLFQQLVNQGDNEELDEATIAEIERTRAMPNDNHPLRTLLQSLCRRILHIAPHRRSAPIGNLQDGPSLDASGTNLVRALTQLQLNARGTYDRVVDFLRRVIPEAGTPIVRIEGDALAIALVDSGGREVLLHETGSGVEQVLTIATFLSTTPEGILLIEEPENFLHPGAQRRLLQNIDRSKGDAHVYISTHSASILSALPDSNCYRVHRDGTGPTVCTRVVPRDRTSALVDIGMRPSCLALYDIVILCEGPNDVPAIRALLEVLSKEDEFKSLARVNIAVESLSGSNVVNANYQAAAFRNLHSFPILIIDGETGKLREAHAEFAQHCKDSNVYCLMLPKYGFEDIFPERVLRAQYGDQVPTPYVRKHLDEPMDVEFKSWFRKKHNAQIAALMTAAEIRASDCFDLFVRCNEIAKRLTEP